MYDDDKSEATVAVAPRDNAKRNILIKKCIAIALVVLSIAGVITYAVVNKEDDNVIVDTAEYNFMTLGFASCTYCKAMAPTRDELKEKYAGKINVTYYDIYETEGGALATKYKANAFPTMIFLKDGVEVDRIVGYVEKSVVEDKFKELGWTE